MRPQIHPVPIYPIGEFLDGSRLCASVRPGHEVDWFPGHRDFDIDVLDQGYDEVEDDAPTLRDGEVQALLGLGHEGWWD